MLLHNCILLNTEKPVSITVAGAAITGISGETAVTVAGDATINCKGAMAFPGLINSHDHLDFNCFAPLGKKTYNNYTEWGHHIHTTCKEEINAVLKIPQTLRTAWGIYKNLLAGVTTVVNHGEWLNINKPLIHIYQQSQNLHSVQFEKKWKWRLNSPFSVNKPCVIHCGEGTDKQSCAEIDELLAWNLLNRALIGVHGVAMTAAQAKKFSGLVWCPESNKVLLNSHAAIAALKLNTRLVFGTDATLTGNWNIWQHLRLARQLKVVSDQELFEMVSSSAAKLWQLNTGQISKGRDADIIIAATATGKTGWDDFYALNPPDIVLVVQQGNIRLFDDTLFDQLKHTQLIPKKISRVMIDGACKWVAGDLPSLVKLIKTYNPAVQIPVSACQTAKSCAHD